MKLFSHSRPPADSPSQAPKKKPKQKRKPRPLLSLAVVSVLCLPWIMLMRNGMRSRQQQAEMAVLSQDFFSQVQPYTRNASAQQFDRLGADLGFAPNDIRGLTYSLDTQAGEAFRQIEEPLASFLSLQAAKVTGPLELIPPELSNYLDQVRPKLDAMQTYLLTHEAPQWEIDIEQMTDGNYPFPSLVNTSNTQRLLLLRALEAHQQQQPTKMLNALEASWRLNQAIAQRPDLVSQVSASVISEYQAGLLRHLEAIPKATAEEWQTEEWQKTEEWQTRLANQAAQPAIVSGLEFDIWLQYQILQKAFARIVAPVSTAVSTTANTPIQSSSHLSAQLSQSLSYWFSPVHYFNLTNIDTAQTAHRALKRLDGLTVCSTSQATAERILSEEQTAQWNEAIAPVPAVLAKRWKVAGDRALALELTQQVMQAKQQAQTAGQWPAERPTTASTTCPKEQWIYKKDKNTLSISLSTELSSPPAVPLSWQITP